MQIIRNTFEILVEKTFFTVELFYCAIVNHRKSDKLNLKTYKVAKRIVIMFVIIIKVTIFYNSLSTASLSVSQLE